MHAASATARKFAQLRGRTRRSGSRSARLPPQGTLRQRSPRARSGQRPGDPGRATPRREGDSYLEELDALRKNFGATQLAGRPGSRGAGRPGAGGAAGETLCARAAHPSCRGRPVRRSPQAAAAAAAAGLRSPGWPRQGPLQGARSPWRPRQMPAGERAEGETWSGAGASSALRAPSRAAGSTLGTPVPGNGPGFSGAKGPWQREPVP
ncbi:uncharacterized protein LOC116591999 [Mustela erminea]|uniref:uncharacterized protein LOC116591999 n=1 Tax=Mustela erminea TaxID=36723 RepID=UPI00138712D7|nr:uncharacterized protein LOC116591999 [Mustela erminea]